jgi:hypothetical protein
MQRIAVSVFGLTLVLAGCTSAVDVGNGVTRHGDYLYSYEGPELEATVATHQTVSALGETWLVLALNLRSVSPSGKLSIERSAVSVMTPDGRRLPLITQEAFRAAYSQIHTMVRRADFTIPSPQTDPRALRYCDRWFFAEVGEGFAADELYLFNFERCSGPLVFEVPGGVQPGRWRLIIELEESRVDVPFELDDRR